MILFNSIILFLNIYRKELYSKIYSTSDDYISNINNTYNLLKDNETSNKGYYYDEKKNIYIKNKKNPFGGFDLRENITEKGSIENIRIYFYKKNILDKLNNNQTSINTKLNCVKEYNKIFNDNKCNNILSGGLMKDWDFNF